LLFMLRTTSFRMLVLPVVPLIGDIPRARPGAATGDGAGEKSPAWKLLPEGRGRLVMDESLTVLSPLS